MSFWSLRIWGVFCLFVSFLMGCRREVSNLLEIWSPCWKKQWRSILKREMHDLEFKVSTIWSHNGGLCCYCHIFSNRLPQSRLTRRHKQGVLTCYSACIQKSHYPINSISQRQKQDLCGRKRREERRNGRHLKRVALAFFSLASLLMLISWQ